MQEKFGPIIPHLNGEVCPFPDAVGEIIYSDGYIVDSTRLNSMVGWERGGEFRVSGFRLPADHHAYGPRKSRMGRAPDQWVNDYPTGCGSLLRRRDVADAFASGRRQGIWRIYLKESAA